MNVQNCYATSVYTHGLEATYQKDQNHSTSELEQSRIQGHGILEKTQKFNSGDVASVPSEYVMP
jgi:hypothetical protein